MATNVWTGVTDDFSINGMAGMVSDNEVFFPPTAPNGPATSMATWTAVDADLVQVMRGVAYSLGTSGAPMDISADKMEYLGTSGKWWIKDGGATTDWVVINSTSRNPIDHDCFNLTGATFTHLDVMRGAGTIAAAGTVTNFIVAPEGKLTIEASATITLGMLDGGIVLASAAVPTARISGGSWTQILGVPTTIDQTGGQSVWKKSGTITTVYARANSVLDFTQADGVVTITTLHKHPSAKILGWNPENNGIVVATNLRVISSDQY